jgi:hypothetical protein
MKESIAVTAVAGIGASRDIAIDLGKSAAIPDR